MIEESIKNEELAIQKLDDAGIESTKKLKDGSIAALEKQLRKNGQS